MSKSTSEQRSLASADRLERKLNRLIAEQRKQLKNEDIVRLEPSGEVSYERVRTVAEPLAGSDQQCAETNNFPETPVSPENGKIFAAEAARPAAESAANETPQALAEPSLARGGAAEEPADEPVAEDRISFHDAATTGKEIASALASGVREHPDKVDHREADASRSPVTGEPEAADPLEELLARALARPGRGRPAAFDERNKGQLVALLSLGMSLRQAAAVLGVSHTTVRNTLQADATLAEEITAARFQAQLQPLACVIREARRSWKAATWLLKYLDAKIATHEETPDERRARQDRERDEFFARPPSGGKKK
jgi:hypothetical protein